MTDETKRLFFALDCPPVQRKAIAQWRAELGLRTGKPVPADNFHLTLLFLGAVPLAQINEVCEAAGQVRTPGEALKIALDRLQVWHRAGVLSLAPEQAPQALLRLVYALEQAMLPFGFDETPREFRPHLTLAREYRAPEPESATPPAFFLRAERFRILQDWPLI
jgi:2'-5' RNA ligase